MNNPSGKPYLTLRQFVRQKPGTFSARDVLGEYMEYRSAVRLDVIRRQLELMAEDGELMRHKCGLRVFYSVKTARGSMVREFDMLIMPVRLRNQLLNCTGGSVSWPPQLMWGNPFTESEKKQ